MKRKRAIIVLSVIGVSVLLGILIGYSITLTKLRKTDNEYQKQLYEKIAEAERVLYYEISQDRPLRMRLAPNDEEIKVISHLNVPKTSLHDNLKEYLYGLNVVVIDNSGEKLWDNVYWEKTKATKIKQDQSLVGWESTFYLDREDAMPTDSRLTTVFLSGLLQDMAESNKTPKYLEIFLESEDYRSAVIRCYRRMERPAEDRKLAWKRLSLATRLELAQTNVYSIDILTKEEKSNLVTHKWERIFAEGKKNRDYVLQPVYLANPRDLSPLNKVTEESAPQGFLIHWQRFACVNVHGKGRLKIEITRLAKHEIGNELELVITASRLDDTGKVSRVEKRLDLLSHENYVGEIFLDVPPGLHTYTIEASVPCFARFYVEHSPVMLVGYELPAISSSVDWGQIAPIVGTATYYRSLGVNDSPVIEADVGYNKRYSSYICIFSRLRIEADNAVGFHQYSVYYDVLDSQKKTITRGEYTVRATASVYDFYSYRQGTVEGEYIPSESDQFYLPLPYGAKTIRLYSKQVVDFALYAYYGGGGRQIYITESSIARKNVVLSDCRDYDREWYYFRPNNYEELNELDRAIRISWQCQMVKERRKEKVFARHTERIARMIAPDIYKKEVRLLEKVDPSDDELHGSDLTFFEIRPNENIPIQFADHDDPHNQLPVPMEGIYYKPDDEQSSATLFIGGKEYDKYLLSGKAGSIYPEEISQGIQDIRFSDLPSSHRLFINRAPLSLEHTKQSVISTIWKRRTSYRLLRESPIVLTIQKESSRAKTLNIIIYRDVPGDCVIRARIHGSTTRLPSRSHTANERIYHIRTWRELESFEISTGAWQSRKQIFTLTLGEDLGVGEYRIQLDLLSGKDALLRFLVMSDAKFIINSNRSAALNLIGPGVLRLELKPNLSMATGKQSASYHLISKRLSYQGKVALVKNHIPKEDFDAVSELEFIVPPGLHTYSFSTPEKADCSLYFYVDKVPQMLTGKYQLFYPESSGASSFQSPHVRIEPESHITRYYRSSDGDKIIPLVVDLPTSEPPSRRAIRIALRLRLLESEKELPQSSAVYYEILTPTGEVISNGEKDLVATKLAVYDRYFSKSRSGSPSEVSYFYIHLPYEGGQLRVWSNDRNADLALHSQPPEYVRDSYIPEDKLASDRVNVLDSSHSKQWYPLKPDNHRELFFAGRLTKIESQKLVIKERDMVVGTGPQKLWRTIAPEIYQSEIKVLERVSSTNGQETSEDMQPNKYPYAKMFFQIHLNEPTQLGVPSLGKPNNTPTDVEFMFFCAQPINDGKMIHLWLDGHKHSSYRITEVIGSLTISGISQDVHTFEFRGEKEGDEVSLFTNYHSAEFDPGNDTLWQKRTFYSFTPMESLKLLVYKINSEELSLNVAAYFEAPSSERCALKVTIMPLSPPAKMPGTSEKYTSRERIYYLKSEPTKYGEDIIPITDLPFDSSILSESGRFVIKLHDDLNAGKYIIVLEPVGQLSGMLRFFFSEDAPFVLREGQFVSLNLSGPGNLRIEALDRETETSLRITRLAATGEIVTEDILLPPSDDSGISAFNVTIPPGLASIRIENLSRDDVSLIFYVDRASEMLVESLSPPSLADKQTWTRVEPDMGTYTYFQCSPKAGLEILLPHSQKGIQTLRITSRLPIEIKDRKSQDCRVSYQIFDNIGRRISEGDFTIEAASSNDTFYYPRQFHAEAPSEAVYRYVELPYGANMLRFSSEKNIHLRFHHRFSSVERMTYVPEDYTRSETVRLLGETSSRIRWELLVPENRIALARMGKLIKVETQKKLVDYLRGEGTEVVEKVAKTLAPGDYEEKTYLFEPYQVTAPSEVERSTVTYSRIPLDKTILFNVVNYDAPNGQVPTDVQLLYRSQSSWADTGNIQPNPVIVVFVDSRRFTEFPTMSPQGGFVIPSIQPGLHQLRVEVQRQDRIGADEIELFINQLPEDLTGVSIWKRRTAYTLEHGKSLTTSIVKTSSEPVILNVVCHYDNVDLIRHERFTILVTIDKGIRSALPDRSSVQYTALIRKYSIKNQLSTAFYVNKQGIKPGLSRTFFVPLYDDIPAGRHTLNFKLLSGKSAKIRFFIMESDGIEEKVRFWRES